MSKTFTAKNGTEFIIRPVTEDDAQDLLDFMDSVIAEEIYLEIEKLPPTVEDEKAFLRRYIDSDDRAMFVAEVSGKAIGNVGVERGSTGKRKHTAHIGVAIMKPYREMGIGTALMEEAIAWADSQGVEKAFLSVFSTNTRAIKLYEKLGFEPEGKQEKHFKLKDGYADKLYMAKWLR